jgi:parallel beta-helix repeat protein
VNKKRLFTEAFASILLISAVIGILPVKIAKTNFINFPTLKAITIKSDGTIEPAGMPIVQVGNVYYLTRDISNYSFRIACDNIIIDGQGFTIQGNKSKELSAYGFYLLNRDNVTIRNFNIKSYSDGIEVLGNYQTSQLNTGIKIVNNVITDCDTGILFDSATGDHIIGNRILNNEYGIGIIYKSSSNTIQENLITNNIEVGINVVYAGNNTFNLNTISENKNGVRIDYSQSNTFTANSIEHNDVGILFSTPLVGTSNNNLFYNNNVVQNSRAVYEEFHQSGNQSQQNIWDNGSRGNYWSDYLKKYPNATEIDSSGVGDTPYVIRANNTDNYPLMTAVDIPKLTIDFPVPIYVATPTPAPTPTPTSPTPTSTPALTPNPSPTPSPSLEPKETATQTQLEHFPTTLVATASGASVAIIGAGLLVYFKKRKT